MMNTVLRNRLSALALAGLASGLAAGPLRAADSTATTTVDSSTSGAAVDTSAKSKLLATTSAKAFAKVAKKEGVKVEKTSCAGKNSCKGVYFSAGKAVELSCKGTASCKGLKADI